MMRLSDETVERLNNTAFSVRDLATRMISIGKWGHVGGTYSMAEILSVLYEEYVRIDPKNPEDKNRDYVILSKAHCSPALYAALACKGFITKEEALSYCSLDGLDGHLDQLHTPGVEVTGGSLGIGLSYAVGIAKGLKMQERFSQRVYCIVGDGELSEGEIWEGVMAAAQYRLDNLITIVDYNKVMAKGFVYEEMNQEPLAERFQAFGWTVLETDGHDVEALYQTLHRAKYICVTGKPVCILAHSVKGKGVEQCEFNYKWHTHAPGIEKANEFLEELAKRYDKSYVPITQEPRKIRSLEDIIEGGKA